MGFQQLIVVLSENVVNLYKEVILIPIGRTVNSGIGC